MEAFSAGDTVFFSSCLYVRRKPMLGDFEDIGTRHIDTGLNAAETHHAAIKPLPDQRSSIRSRRDLSFFGRKFVLLYAELIRAVLKLAFSSGITDRTVERMIDQ
jgi:hypothetical protein